MGDFTVYLCQKKGVIVIVGGILKMQSIKNVRLRKENSEKKGDV